MKEIAFELELFVTKKKKIISPALLGLPHDGNGMVMEIRGDKFNNIEDAYYSVVSTLKKLTPKLKGLGVCTNVNWVPIDDNVRGEQEQFIRKMGQTKDISWQNMYGVDQSPLNNDHLSAGLHIHLSNKQTITFDDKHREVNSMFDMISDFKSIEAEFGKDIDGSNRVRGFYELKSHGGVEYRSLPMSVFFKHNFIERIKKCKLV